MTRKNRRKSSHSRFAPTLLFSCFILAGCGREREEFLWILGSHLFLIYAASLAAVLALQRLHQWPVFISLVEKISKPASVVGAGVAVVGGWIFLSGIPQLFDEPGSKKLKPFLGVMVLIAGVHFCRWARASSATDKVRHAKVFTMTVGFVVGLAYILSGAGMLSLG